MDDTVKRFKERRAARIMARMDDSFDEGRWVTTEKGDHVHLNEAGEPDAGNKYVIAAMKSYKERPKAGLKIKKPKESYAESIGQSSFVPQVKNGYVIDKKGNIHGTNVHKGKDGALHATGTKMAFVDENGDSFYRPSESFLDENGDAIILDPPGYEDNAETAKSETAKSEAPKFEEKTYDRIPLTAYMGSKYASPEDLKKKRETIKRFIKDAKVGNVYSASGGFGSAGDSLFEIVHSNKSSNHMALKWVNSKYGPVVLNSSNVLSFIKNGAKLVEQK